MSVGEEMIHLSEERRSPLDSAGIYYWWDIGIFVIGHINHGNRWRLSNENNIAN